MSTDVKHTPVTGFIRARWSRMYRALTPVEIGRLDDLIAAEERQRDALVVALEAAFLTFGRLGGNHTSNTSDPASQRIAREGWIAARAALKLARGES